MRIDRLNTLARLAPLCVVFCVTFLVAFCTGSTFLTALYSSANSGSVGVSVNLTETIALSLKDSRDLEVSNSHLAIPITPDSNGNIGTADLIADVATNNLTGYTLTMNAQTSNTALVHTATASNTIASTGAGLASPTVLTPNHWGYWRWEDGRTTTPTTFSRIPGTAPDTLRVTTAPAASSTTTLSFGANVDMDTVHGSYRQTMVLSVVSNYVPIPPPQEPDPNNPTTYGAMQYMTNAQCSTTRGTAYDARNGQTYYVQKIAGLCWMETNLSYSGNGNWNSAWGYPDDRYANRASNDTANTNDDVRPIAMPNIGGGSYAYPVSQPAIMYPTGGSSNYTNTAANGGYYGLLYNWCAAMGGQVNACNNSETNQANLDTTQSFCPAGWRLPTGTPIGNTGGEFQTLNNAINSGSTTSDLGLRNTFLGVYSGLYYSELHDQGTYGYYWSSTVGNASNARTLAIGSNIVAPGTGNANKSDGRAVRCVL